MALHTRIRIGLALALLAGGFGIAFAQSTAVGNPAIAAGGVSGPRDEGANLTPAQMRQEATQYLPAMELSGQTIRRQLEQAREARDVVKVLCLNDKLTQVDVAVRSTRDRVQALGQAVEQNSQDRSRHEFAVIQVLRERVRALSQEASQCIGEETGFIDEPKVSVEVDPAIPEEDPAVFPDDPVIVTEPPTIVSSPR